MKQEFERFARGWGVTETIQVGKALIQAFIAQLPSGRWVLMGQHAYLGAGGMQWARMYGVVEDPHEGEELFVEGDFITSRTLLDPTDQELVFIRAHFTFFEYPAGDEAGWRVFVQGLYDAGRRMSLGITLASLYPMESSSLRTAYQHVRGGVEKGTAATLPKLPLPGGFGLLN